MSIFDAFESLVERSFHTGERLFEKTENFIVDQPERRFDRLNENLDTLTRKITKKN